MTNNQWLRLMLQGWAFPCNPSDMRRWFEFWSRMWAHHYELTWKPVSKGFISYSARK